MLIEKSVEVVTVKVSALFNPKDDQFPHFRLLFYIDRNNFLVLVSRIKRYAAVRRLSLLQENAPYTVYEISR